MRRILDFINDAALRAYVRLQVFAAQEPVRLRASLTSLVLAAAFLFPTLASADIVDHVVTVGAVALPILVGESARRKVTPANDE